MKESRTVAVYELETSAYSREEFEAIAACLPSLPRGVLKAAAAFVLYQEYGAPAKGTPKQNARDEIEKVACWVKEGLKLGALGSQAREHLAQNRLRHPVRGREAIAVKELPGFRPPFGKDFDELMRCLFCFEKAHWPALKKENLPEAPRPGARTIAAERQLILAIREAWLYADWPEGAPPRNGWPAFRHLCLRPLEERFGLQHVSDKVWEKRLTSAQKNWVGDRK